MVLSHDNALIFQRKFFLLTVKIRPSSRLNLSLLISKGNLRDSNFAWLRQLSLSIGRFLRTLATEFVPLRPKKDRQRYITSGCRRHRGAIGQPAKHRRGRRRDCVTARRLIDGGATSNLMSPAPSTATMPTLDGFAFLSLSTVRSMVGAVAEPDRHRLQMHEAAARERPIPLLAPVTRKVRLVAI